MNSVEPLIQGVKAAETIECNDTVNKKECDREMKARKPDIVLVNKNGRSCASEIIVLFQGKK